MEFLSDASLGTIGLAILLFALVLTFGFEFVNGFHDTANAVATVIYTHSLTPTQAVVWSGLWNFLEVVASSGAVAFAIVALLPIELILHVRSEAAFAMVMALLLSAIIWNVGTWYFGLPASSSHTLSGSIVGVGLMNSVIAGGGFGEGVNWGKVEETVLALVTSPMIGFVGAAARAGAHQAPDQGPRSLPPAQGQGAAALEDPRGPAADLHRRQFRARLE